MKKFFFVFLFLWFIPNITFGILSDPLGFDLYKKIDKGLYELEIKYTEKEMKGGEVSGSIIENLKKNFKQADLNTDCIRGELTIKEVEQIVADNNSTTILKKILQECFGENESLPETTVAKYMNVIQESFAENSQKAQTKTSQMYKIGRIGMYSDGVEENSPFDLMTDLNEIDQIIFESDIPYDGVNQENLGKVTEGLFKGLPIKEASAYGKYQDNILFSGKYKTPNNQTNSPDPNLPTTPTQESTIVGDGSKDVCTTNTSGLDEKTVKEILATVKNTPGNGGVTNPGNPGNPTDPSNPLDPTPSPGGGVSKPASPPYKKVNDSGIWPCNDFFCIIIKFVTYEHKLLGGGKNLSIEGLIKRSNEHLRKTASTSLIQANMSVNNYELGLKNLNLPDTFHIGLQVSYKPVPIINVEKENKDSSSDEFKHTTLLETYYKNLGLDYKRANDLSIFRQKEAEAKSVLDSGELPISVAEEKMSSFHTYIETNKKQNDYISNTIVDKKVIGDDIQDFYTQFIELETFTNAMLDYVLGMGGVITKMREIPTGG